MLKRRRENRDVVAGVESVGAGIGCMLIPPSWETPQLPEAQFPVAQLPDVQPPSPPQVLQEVGQTV